MSKAYTQHLHKHPVSGIYYFRIAIPKALKQKVKQREWKKSLKTRDPIEAKRTARLVTLQVEYLFNEIAQGNRMPKKPDIEYRQELIGHGFKRHPDGTVEMEKVAIFNIFLVRTPSGWHASTGVLHAGF